jgi:PAS domain S-box-containing protein
VQGTYFPFRDEAGTVRYILADAREVTEELHAMERVATIESRLNAALTIGKVGNWVFDTTTKRILGDANFIRLFKMTRQRAETFNLADYVRSVYEDDRDRVASVVERSVTEGLPFEQEYRVRLKDGTMRSVLARGKPEVHEGHQVFSGVVVDITEQRDLEAQIELAREQDVLNRQAARVLQQRNEELEAIGRSKDEFVALASHQLRTPATAVKQYIGMMWQGYVGDITEEQADVLEKAFEGNERQIRVINQILSAARADTGRLMMTPVPVDLRALVQGLMTDMAPSLQQRHHTTTLLIPTQPVQVNADLGYMRMAIENVLHNASIYTPEGGGITVKIKQHGKQCTLSIADTGVGIREADMGKLFVKFSRIHNPLSVEAGGSGIGLYLTAEIVRLHRGSIAVESRLGEGTTFAISSPLMQNERSGQDTGKQKQPAGKGEYANYLTD